MNLLQSPPAHDPTTDTIDTFRTRNFSLNDPPGYNYEGAPPLYYCHDGTGNEAGMPERPSRKKIKAKARKVAFIRIMASVVVVSTVALIVGGVASKIDGMKKAEQARYPLSLPLIYPCVYV